MLRLASTQNLSAPAHICRFTAEPLCSLVSGRPCLPHQISRSAKNRDEISYLPLTAGDIVFNISKDYYR